METTPTILVASAEYITLAKAIVLTDDNRKHQLVMAFGPFLAQAEIWKAKAAAINVTDITQTVGGAL